MYTAAQKAGILAEAREHLRAHPKPAEREQAAPSRQPELVYKTNHDAAVARAPSATSAVASESELPWREWVDRRIDTTLEAAEREMGEVLCKELDVIQRELQLLKRELKTLRDEVAVERGLRDLRTKIEAASAQVPEVPALVAGLERAQARLERELEATKKKLTRARADQTMTDFRVAELRKQTESRAAGIEVKLETASFTMRELHPNARDALREFAAVTLGNKTAPRWAPSAETIWAFDSNVRVHGSSNETA
jgi:hypothetical protein